MAKLNESNKIFVYKIMKSTVRKLVEVYANMLLRLLHPKNVVYDC